MNLIVVIFTITQIFLIQGMTKIISLKAVDLNRLFNSNSLVQLSAAAGGICSVFGKLSTSWLLSRFTSTFIIRVSLFTYAIALLFITGGINPYYYFIGKLVHGYVAGILTHITILLLGRGKSYNNFIFRSFTYVIVPLIVPFMNLWLSFRSIGIILLICTIGAMFIRLPDLYYVPTRNNSTDKVYIANYMETTLSAVSCGVCLAYVVQMIFELIPSLKIIGFSDTISRLISNIIFVIIGLLLLWEPLGKNQLLALALIMIGFVLYILSVNSLFVLLPLYLGTIILISYYINHVGELHKPNPAHLRTWFSVFRVITTSILTATYQYIPSVIKKIIFTMAIAELCARYLLTREK